ncbi:MAG: hypothetical protein ACJASL_000136 [Paraglaciecola sp.]|jgi:hypothetical protein
MNYSVKSQRRRNNISLDLKLGYRNVWAERMSSVIQMIGCGMRLKDIGNHYGCTAANVGDALRRTEHRSIHYVRASFIN